MVPPRRDALADSCDKLSQAEAKRIAAHLVSGDVAQRIRRTRQRLVLIGVLAFLILAGVVGALLWRTSRTSLGKLEQTVERQRQLAPQDED